MHHYREVVPTGSSLPVRRSARAVQVTPDSSVGAPGHSESTGTQPVVKPMRFQSTKPSEWAPCNRWSKRCHQREWRAVEPAFDLMDTNPSTIDLHTFPWDLCLDPSLSDTMVARSKSHNAHGLVRESDLRFQCSVRHLLTQYLRQRRSAEHRVPIDLFWHRIRRTQETEFPRRSVNCARVAKCSCIYPTTDSSYADE